MFEYFEEECPDPQLRHQVKALEAQFKALLAKDKSVNFKSLKYAVLKDPHSHLRTFRDLTKKALI